MMVRRGAPQETRLTDAQRDELLAALGTARTALIYSEQALKQGCVTRAALASVIGNIDDLAFLLIGDRRHFYLKAHATPAGFRG